MREIKFRAWNKVTEKMLYDGFLISLKGLLYNDFNFDHMNGIPLQYTGLKDKNGVEIYEGDIVEVVDKSNIKIIEFRKGCFGFETNKNGFYTFDMESLNKIVRVIGNIYETPELLNKD